MFATPRVTLLGRRPRALLPVESWVDPPPSAALAQHLVDQAPADAADRLERLAAWERVIAWAQARQITEITGFVDTAAAAPAPGSNGLEAVESAEAEIALMLHTTTNAAGCRADEARTWVHRHPATLAALEAGQITLAKARIIADGLTELDEAAALAAEAHLLQRAAGQTPGQLREAVRRAVLRADPDAATRRQARQRRERKVVLYPERDGMATLSATLPAAEATGMWAVLDQHARACPADDGRSMDARRVDTLIDLVLGETGFASAATAATGKSAAPPDDHPGATSPAAGAPATGEGPTADSPTAASPTAASPTGDSLTAASPTSGSPTGSSPTSGSPTSGSPTSGSPTSGSPTSGSPTSGSPTGGSPTADRPTGDSPTSGSPTSGSPTSGSPTADRPTGDSHASGSHAADGPVGAEGTAGGGDGAAAAVNLAAGAPAAGSTPPGSPPPATARAGESYPGETADREAGTADRDAWGRWLTRNHTTDRDPASREAEEDRLFSRTPARAGPARPATGRPPDPTRLPGLAPPGGAPACRTQVSIQIRVTVPLDVLAGHSDTHAELAGYGPITAEQARALAADPDSVWRRLVTDPLSGALLDVGTQRYRPPAHLAEHVISRHATCQFPGCRTPAHRCDLDHNIPYGHPDGTTSTSNLGPPCPLL